VLDVVVTGLFGIAIPALLWLTWRRNADDATDDSHLSFRDWDHALGLRSSREALAELEAQVRARQLRHRGRQHVALRAGK